ncbi:zinc finger protein 84-like [Eublepharis macularius]|uniref:Zinc finger protein 84-like n=1 Tax=Eublepharis macularius TaxID=481883 RepID=A0AA97KVD1_EUBMA|nr:zinc finger protein 84-like [Eublepharis macularius]
MEVPEAFVEVTVRSNEGQCSLVGRRQRVLYKNVMQENSVASLGGLPVRSAELLTRLERGEEAWVPDLQSSDESADEGPVKPTLKRLPKGGMWWGRYRSPVTYPSSDSSNSDGELESEAEEEKHQRGGQRLIILHRNLLVSSRGNGLQNPKVRDTSKNGPQLKKHSEGATTERPTLGDRRSTCPDCGQTFKSKLSLSNHQRKHTRERPYKCSRCGEKFVAKKVLAAHQMSHAEEKGYKHPSSMKITMKLQTVLPENRPYKCTQCEKSFKVKDHLVQHEKIHSKERPHKCPSCGKGFVRKEHLTRHQEIHRRQENNTFPKTVKLARTNLDEPVAPKKKPSVVLEKTVALNTRHQKFSINRFKCRFCGRCLRAKTLLVDHERSHREKRRYKCSHCNKSFYHKNNFQRHKNIHLRRQPDCKPSKRMKQLSAKSCPSDSGNFHTSEDPSKTSIDRKIITRSFNRAQHLKLLTKKKVFKCQYCGKCVSTSSSLVNHERIHRGKKPYKCQDCEESFHQKHHLDRHLVTHTRRKPSKHSKNLRGLNVKSSPPVRGKINTGLKPYKGLINEHIVTRNSHFTRQLKIHTEDKLYKCQFCGKVKRTKNSLLSHERNHKGAKPYICLECGKRFSQKNYLGCHQRSHMRKKPDECLDKNLTAENASLSCGSPQETNLPYLCLKCGKSFDEKYYLSRHERIHTGTKPFKCATCGKGFIQNWHLKRHEQTHLKERDHKQPAESEENQLFSTTNNGISSEKKDPRDPPVNVNEQTTSGIGERNATPDLKVAETELLAVLEGCEVGLSNGIEQGDMTIEAEINHQALSRKNKRKQQNQREAEGSINQLLKRRSERARNKHNKPSKNDLSQRVRQTKRSKKNSLQHLKKEKVHAGWPLGLQANAVRKSKRETQLVGKRSRSCFCQQEEPEMTPGSKYKNSQTCRKEISHQKEQQANVSSDMSKRTLKSCKPRKAFLGQQYQKMFSGESKMEAAESPVGGASACAEQQTEQQKVRRKKVRGNSQNCVEESEAVDNRKRQALRRLPKSNPEKSCQRMQAINELKSTALQGLGTASANWQPEAQLTSLKTVEKLPPQSCKKAQTSDDQQEKTMEKEPETSASEKEIAVRHRRPEKRQFKHVCKKCNKSFRSKANLVIHGKNHTGHRPFQCTQCEKSFYALPTLNIHMRIHTGEKPYQCSECSFRCNVSSNLSRHKKTHTRVRPHACHLCEKRFWFSHSLFIHLKDHLEEEPYKCSDCGRVFTQENFLKLHRRFKHSSEVVEGPEEEQRLHSPGDFSLCEDSQGACSEQQSK